jgi:CubicO group peptidase (beta-lactamase class C family)
MKRLAGFSLTAQTFLSILAIALAETSFAQITRAAESAGEVAGMSRDRMARIAPVMKGQIDKGIFPGAITLIARHGQVVHYETHGFQDAAKTKPMTKDALFRLASMTKPIVAVAAVMLVEQGAIKLNDPIINWLPELKGLKVETQKIDKDGTVKVVDVPLDRPIWVQDLLRHTAGFVYAASTSSPRIKAMYEKANIEGREAEITGDEMLKALGSIPLAHQPGTFWEYSISIDVLGLLLERVTEKHLDQLLQEMLFNPLGMKSTSFHVAAENATRFAEALDSDPLKASEIKYYRVRENPASTSYLKGGGGLVGTMDDYLRFAQMVLNGGELDGRRYLSKLDFAHFGAL